MDVCLYVCKIQCSYSYFCVLIFMYVCMCIYFSLILSDPNLRVDQVGVPVLVAKVVTISVAITFVRCIYIHTFTYKYTHIYIHTCTFIHSHMLS